MSEKNIVQNHFDILGRGETGCTRALALFIAKHPGILNSFPAFSRNKISKEQLSCMKVSFEDARQNSRFDIHCESKDYNIVIEAKIKSNKVSKEQQKKYLEQMEKQAKTHKHNHLILLTQLENQTNSFIPEEIEKLNIKISRLTWTNILEIIKNHKEKFTVNLADDFERYMMKSVGMKVYTADVAAVVVKQQGEIDNNKLWQEGYHRGRSNIFPLFIARREESKQEKRIAITELFRVEEVLLIGVPDDEEKIAKVYKRLGIKKGKETCVYKFDKANPLKLEKSSPLQFKGHKNGIETYSIKEVLAGKKEKK